MSEGATVQLSKQGISSLGQQLSGHEFSGIHYPSAFDFLPPLKNSAEKEDLPSLQFLISSVVLRLHVEQYICTWRYNKS
jgi:hypothetical protein